METFIGTIIGIVFGGTLTFLASRHYYKKGIKTKSLHCFVQYISEILTDIEPEVKKKMHIDYDGQDVDSLYQVQFIIANTGDYPIRDLIKPLTLQIPNNAEVLDANIVHIEPTGRDVAIKYVVKSREVEFVFPLLNSGEYFVAKLLVKGEAPKPEVDKDKKNGEDDVPYFLRFKKYNLFKFNICVDDLPPELISERLPNDYEDVGSNVFDTTSILPTLSIGSIAFILGFILFKLGDFKPDLFIFNFKLYFSDFTLYKIAVLLGWIITLTLCIGTLAIPLTQLIGLRPKKKAKFRLPSKLNEKRNIRSINYFE
jgi:hypothetical protein